MKKSEWLFKKTYGNSNKNVQNMHEFSVLLFLFVYEYDRFSKAIVRKRRQLQISSRIVYTHHFGERFAFFCLRFSCEFAFWAIHDIKATFSFTLGFFV